MLPHMASMFVIGATATLSNSLPYPARYGHAIRYAVLHTFPFNAHLSLIVNTLVSSCLIIRLFLSALFLGIIHDV